jgi:hypothetical protein
MRRATPLLTLTFGLLLLPLAIFSQKGKAPSLTKEEGQKLTKAENFFDDGLYLRALPIYLELAEKYDQDAYFKYKAGICYLYKSDEKEKSIPFLEAAENLDPNLPDIRYYVGMAYHLNYQFDDAIATLNDYIRKNPKSKLLKKAIRYVEHSNNGKFLVNENQEVEVEIENLGAPINSSAGEYVPVLSADNRTLIFTYRGEKSTGGLMDLKFRPDPEEGEYYEDVFISTLVEENWTTPEPIGPNINTKMHDAAIALSPDGQKLFIYKSTNKDKGDIFMSSLNGSDWGVPQRLGKTINTKYWEGSVSISADGNTLYFASEKPGGFGGRDIYVSRKLPNGEWGPAENMGPKINTQYNDDAPFIHPDGITLFFSSEGHNSIGGYDVMYTVYKNGMWDDPINLGYPLNTTEDDIYYVISADGEKGYFSSNRKGGYGQQDIFVATPGFLGQKPVLALVFGVVSANNKPANATISVSNNETGENVGTYQSNSATGKYLIALTPGVNYKVAFEFEGMNPHIEYVNVKKLDTYVQVEHDIKLTPKSTPPPPLAVQDSTSILQKKIEDQIKKFKSETQSEQCEAKVYARLLKKHGNDESPDITYRVELGTFENGGDFSGEVAKNYGTILSVKNPLNHTTFYIGGFSTLALADEMKEKISKADTTLKNVIVSMIVAGKRQLVSEYYLNEYKKEGCEPKTETPVVASKGGVIGLTDDQQYQNLVKDKGNKPIEGLSFKVEIGAVTDTNDFKLGHLSKYGKIERKLYPDGVYRYSFGPFATLKEAEDFKKELVSKERDASKSFVTVFVFGQRKTLEEYQQKGPCDPDPSLDFSWFAHKNLNDTSIYNKLIRMGGNYCKDGLIFKVQIGAYRFPQNFKYPTVEEFGPAEIIAYPDGITRFTMKQFKTLKEAEAFRQVCIKRGIWDAWVTAVYEGKRMLLDELILVNFYNKSVN